MDLPPFQTLLDRYRNDVYRFLIASVGPQEADDCLQDTFLAALRAYPELKHGDNLKGWLLTIAHRKAIDSHRSHSRRPTPVEEPLDTGVTENPEHGDPELWAEVRRLPPKQRTAVAYRYVNDLPYRDIAGIMGCSEDAARRSAHEGIKRLREVWSS